MSYVHYPEAMTNIFFTIVSKTPSGGATMEDLKEAYSEIKGSRPSTRTIQRILSRLKQLFDPLAMGETPVEDEEPEESRGGEDDELSEALLCIKRVKRGNQSYYIFQGGLSAPSIDLNEALLTALSLYPQHRRILKDTYKEVMRKLIGDALKGLTSYVKLTSAIDAHVYVAEPLPADPHKHARMIEEIFRAIRERKVIWLKYLRTYDGSLTERRVEPYGLLYRFNNWYLLGRCQERKERRIFHLMHVRKLRVLEGSRYRLPSNFSLSEEYSKAWAIRTLEDPGKPEEVRLQVSEGAAERFRSMKFHPSQELKELSGGEVEVSYQLSAAEEMVPWLISWGSRIKVLEPPWLRESVVKTLNHMLEQYRR